MKNATRRMKLLSSALCLCSLQMAHGATISVGIATDANDAEEHLNLASNHGGLELQGEMETLTSSDLETAEQAEGLDWQAIGVQWNLADVAQGSVINSASVTLQYDSVQAPRPGDIPNFTLFADDVDDSATFTTANFDLTSRTRTTASVAWDADTLNPVVGQQTSIDVTSLIQEVVNRPGWSAGNQVSILIFPDVYLDNPGGSPTILVRELEFEAGPGADSATLFVDYEVVPEPSSLSLLGASGIALLLRRRRK